MKKINWTEVLMVLCVVLFLIFVCLCTFIKIWVIVEYGGMPITEVPSWAIPWLTGGR